MRAWGAALLLVLVAAWYANLRLRANISSVGHTPSDAPTFEDALAFIFGPP